MSPMDVIDFADSLVYDERVGVCYAYDPRDALKRRLENTDCASMNCYDCAFTAGTCVFDPA